MSFIDPDFREVLEKQAREQRFREAKEKELLEKYVPTFPPSPPPPGGSKADDGKVRLELVPGLFLVALASVLTFGAKKYAPWNWAKGLAWSRVYGALQRHLNSWWDGRRADPETGYSDLWHASACLMFLVVYERMGLGTDDRHVYPEATNAAGRSWWEELFK